MLCQECGKRPSSLHFTKIVNGEKTELHICEACAREKGEIPGSPNGFSIHSLLSGILDFDPMMGKGITELKPQESIRCESCGMTYTQFSKIGRFGCSDCYSTFGNRLNPLIKRIHGNVAHSGKIPKRSGGRIQKKRQLEQLRLDLHMAITAEEFEKAAQIRDAIRELERTKDEV
jgi:protein arginine kinase activator